MEQAEMNFIKDVGSFLVIAGIFVWGFWMWLRQRTRQAPDLVGLIDELRQENAQLHGELRQHVAELEDRVDFAERRLIQERDLPRLPSVRIPTPV